MALSSEPICVVIATLATVERAPYLRRALASVLGQEAVAAQAIVVVNGAGADPAFVEELARWPGVVLHRLEAPSLPAALAAGRRLVTTRFFAQLDDDDELLPRALEMRLHRMLAPDAPQAVITNGVIRDGAGERLAIEDIGTVERDPLGTLMQRNWLLPGAILFRSERVGPELFEATPRYLEWTYVALALATTHRLAFLAEPTVLHHEGLPFSVDRSSDCVRLRPLAFEALLALDLPATIRRELLRKRGGAWHDAAELARVEGHAREAWTAHLRSVLGPGGWRFVSYTRRLPLAGPGSRPAPRPESTPR